MGKIVFWIVVVFVVLFALRMASLAKGKARRDGAAGPGRKAGAGDASATMVRCERCGVYLPKAEALPVPTGYRCPDPACAPGR